MIVYLDVFIIENTILNLIILVSVSIVLKLKINFLNLSFTSLLGSVFTFVEYYFFPFENNLVNFVIKLVISILIVFVGFKKYKKKRIKIWLTLLVITFIYGGISFFIQIFFETEEYIILNQEIVNIGIFPIKTVILGFVLGFILIYFISKYYNKKIDIDNIICEIEICIGEKKIKTKALIDSGNLLIDLVTKKPVIVIEDKVLKDLVDKEYLDILRNVTLGKLIGDINSDKHKIKIIPFNSLGNSNGILCGIDPDWVRIYYNGEFFTKNIILGVYFGSLNSSDEYSTIIGLDCIKEEII